MDGIFSQGAVSGRTFMPRSFFSQLRGLSCEWIPDSLPVPEPSGKESLYVTDEFPGLLMAVILGEGKFLVVFILPRLHNPVPWDLVKGNPAKTIEGQKEGLGEETAGDNPIHA